MANERISLDDVYSNEASQGSMFKAVKMMSEEARFINDQANMGFIELNQKPTTIAMSKFKEDKLSTAANEKSSAVEEEEDILSDFDDL